MAKKMNYLQLGDDWKVSNVRKLEWGTFFTLVLPGLQLFNLRVVPEGKGYDAFISVPEDKGNDGKWYKRYLLYLSEDDEAAVIAAVDDILDEQFEEEKAKGRKARK